MNTSSRNHSIVAAGLAAIILVVPLARPSAQQALAVDSARVTIAGTSNVHEYTATTTTVRVTVAQIGSAAAGPAFWDNVLAPGGMAAFEIAVPAGTLKSGKDGLDKNMYKALKVQEHPDITFRLVRFDFEGQPAGTGRAIGALTIAGVEREVTLAITTTQADSKLTVKGRVDLLMTDYGITPPKAMMGMLKTDPKVTVTFETVLAVPLT